MQCACCKGQITRVEFVRDGELLCRPCAVSVAELASEFPRLMPCQRQALAQVRHAMTARQWRSLHRWVSRCYPARAELIGIAFPCEDPGVRLQ